MIPQSLVECFSIGINENRVATSKMNEMRLQGLFLRGSRDLFAADLIANGTFYTTSPLIHTSELRNSESYAGFYVLRHNDATLISFVSIHIHN